MHTNKRNGMCDRIKWEFGGFVLCAVGIGNDINFNDSLFADGLIIISRSHKLH